MTYFRNSQNSPLRGEGYVPAGKSLIYSVAYSRGFLVFFCVYTCAHYTTVYIYKPATLQTKSDGGVHSRTENEYPFWAIRKVPVPLKMF